MIRSHLLLLPTLIAVFSTPHRVWADDDGSSLTIARYERTMVPGESCPLVDDATHKDLLDAATSLSGNLATLSKCAGKTSGDSSIASTLESIKTAASKLDSYSQQPGVLPADQEVQTNLQTLLQGMDSLSSTLAASGTSSGCSTESSTGIIMSIADLVHSVTPVATAVLKEHPELAAAAPAAIPFVIGASATSDVVRMIGKFHAANSLDTKDPEVRRAILENICEYTRIKNRLREYNGQERARQSLRDTTTELEREKDKAADEQAPVDLAAQLRQAAIADIRKVEEMKKDLQSDNSPLFTCSYLRSALQTSGEKLFPSLQTLEAAFNEAGLDNSLRSKAAGLLSIQKAEFETILHGNDGDCAKNVPLYLTAMHEIASLSLTNDQLKQKAEYMAQENSTDALAKAAAEKKQSLAVESDRRATLAATVTPENKSLVHSLNPDISVMNDTEIVRNLKDIESALFMPHVSWIPNWVGMHHLAESPAYSWYRDAKEQALVWRKTFTTEMAALRNEALKYHIQTGHLQQTGYYIDKFGKMGASDLRVQDTRTQQAFADINNLAPINLQQLPENSEYHSKMCIHLDGVLNNWQATLDYVGSMMLFCKYLTPYFDTGIDANLIDACQGDKDWLGHNHGRLSVLQKLLSEQDTIEAEQDALLIDKKMQELKCSHTAVVSGAPVTP